MKLAILGSRDYTDYSRMVKLLTTFGFDGQHIEIVSSGEEGVGSLAKSFAEDCGLPYIEFPVDKKKNGKSASQKSNEAIVGACNFLIVLWDGCSLGTENALKIAHEQKKSTLIFYH